MIIRNLALGFSIVSLYFHQSLIIKCKNLTDPSANTVRSESRWALTKGVGSDVHERIQ
jgi:hypothetical protein